MVARMSKKRIILISVSYSALILWMIFIFAMSAQTGELSANTSGGLIERLCKIFVSNFGELSEKEKTDIISSLSFPIRKAAHFSEYAVLACLLNFAIIQSSRKVKLTLFCLAVSFVSGVMYSITDEIHQYFVPGRACAFTDVLIDSSGVLFGCVLFALIYKFLEKNKAPTV